MSKLAKVKEVLTSPYFVVGVAALAGAIVFFKGMPLIGGIAIGVAFLGCNTTGGVSKLYFPPDLKKLSSLTHHHSFIYATLHTVDCCRISNFT